jgi:hypothetical protein
VGVQLAVYATVLGATLGRAARDAGHSDADRSDVCRVKDQGPKARGAAAPSAPGRSWAGLGGGGSYHAMLATAAAEEGRGRYQALAAHGGQQHHVSDI